VLKHEAKMQSEAMAFQAKMEQDQLRFESELALQLQQQNQQFQLAMMQQNQVFQAEVMKKLFAKEERTKMTRAYHVMHVHVDVFGVVTTCT